MSDLEAFNSNYPMNGGENLDLRRRFAAALDVKDIYQYSLYDLWLMNNEALQQIRQGINFKDMTDTEK